MSIKVYTLYMICASVNKNKYYCYFNTRAICTVHVVISVDSFNITISVSAKFLEPAMFWHMNGEANKNMDASQQIYTFSS